MSILPILMYLTLTAMTNQTYLDNLTPGRQTACEFKQTSGKMLHVRYLLYLPEDYSKNTQTKWPLMMFLHGSGERGTDINWVKKHGIPKVIEDGKSFPFILISPQCDYQKWWDDDALLALFDDLESKLRVDKNRIYLTGLSMGGYACWSMGKKDPNRFAAIAPICGAGDTRNISALKNVPMWAFHSDNDDAVPIQQEQALVDALKQAGGNIKFTIFKGVGHNVWTQTYDNPEFYTWILSQHKTPTVTNNN